ncbi:MAG: Spy/CpxP family protein refolding chaperone [Candidatus Binatia bacterium]
MNGKLKIAFLASILFNVLLLGVLLGALPHYFEKDHPRRQRIEKALKELPEPVQAQFREKMESSGEAGEPLREQSRRAREEAIRILIAEPFDESAYDRQISKINELRVQMATRMASIVKDVARDLPLKQREVLAEVLRRRPSPDK